MLAAASVIDGTLQVSGDNRDEVLSVRQVNSELIVYSSVADSPGQNIFTTSAADISQLVIRGFGGSDQLVNRTSIPSLIQGGGGDDVIIGGTGNDTLQGADGNDRIIGDFGANAADIASSLLGGDDQIAGGSGADVIEGVGGNDRINGQSGNDTLRGGSGQDIISGGLDNDLINGNTGDDVITGDDGNDQIWGHQGNDVLLGETGNDSLFGGEGNDRLRGNAGIDFLVGGHGDDVFFSVGNANSRDTLNGGHGDDIYRFEGGGQAAQNQIVVNNVLVHDLVVETLSSGNDKIEYMGLGFAGQPNVSFKGNAIDTLTYDQRIVGSETPDSIEIFTDLRVFTDDVSQLFDIPSDDEEDSEGNDGLGNDEVTDPNASNSF
jgi:Ca2+-binding RTX toxin-like protein